MPKPKRDPKYLDWLASQGCMISGEPATIHHVRICGSARDDHRAIPLAPRYHLYQHGPKTSIEGLGKRKFELLYGIDLEAKIAQYRSEYELSEHHRRAKRIGRPSGGAR